MIPMLVLTHGIPGSGKSTVAARLSEVYDGEVIIAERDQIRADHMPKDYHEKGHTTEGEAEVERIQYGLVSAGLAEGKIVVASDTNLKVDRVYRLAALAKEQGAVIMHVHFDIKPVEAKRRVAQRASEGGRNTPDWCIDGMVEEHYSNGHIMRYSVVDGEVVLRKPSTKELTTEQEIYTITALQEFWR